MCLCAFKIALNITDFVSVAILSSRGLWFYRYGCMFRHRLP